MRVVGFIPSKLNSRRLPRKNVLPLGGVPLVNYCLRTLNAVDLIEEAIIFASEPSIKEYIEKGLRYSFMERPKELDGDRAAVQDFISEFLKREKAGVIVLQHITSPFIKAETVRECLDKVLSGAFDSAFAALSLRKFAWFKGRPLNYSHDSFTPRTQDLQPVLLEQGGLYVFRREIFEESGQRIGKRPYIKLINEFEGHDIDTADDFKLAEYIIERKMC